MLIPKNNFIEIVEDAVKKHKHINEVLDLVNYNSYLDAIPKTHISTDKAKKKS